MPATSDQIREVEETLKKRFGKKVLYKGSDEVFKIRRLSTGVLTLDWMLKGGFAVGRTIELYGGYSALKTYVALSTIAQAQKRGLKCGLADVEKSFDPIWAASLGVNVDDLSMVGDLETGEEIVDYLEVLIRSRIYDVLVVDSVAAFTPKDELDEISEKQQIGKMGKLTSKMMRKLTASNGMGNSGTTLIIINQVRESPGISFGNPEKPVGGRAIGFFSSTIVEFRKGSAIKEERNTADGSKLKKKAMNVGRNIHVRIEKDKTGALAESDGNFDFYYEGGIDRFQEIISLGLVTENIESVGNKIRIVGTEKTFFPKAFRTYLEENDKERVRLEMRIRKGTK